MGHLLGTGLLDAREEAIVAGRLAGPDMDSGFGLRTLTVRLAAVLGAELSRRRGVAARHRDRGARTEPRRAMATRRRAAGRAACSRPPTGSATGCRSCSAATRGRPALPSAYPAACRPQAWSAAAPLAALVAVSGVRIDPTAGVVRHPVRTSTALGAFALRGLRAGDARLDVHVADDGLVRVETTGANLATEVAEE